MLHQYQDHTDRAYACIVCNTNYYYEELIDGLCEDCKAYEENMEKEV